VDKIVGDAIIALFGAPVAHEDDAERAVRAALQMQRTLDTARAGIGVDVRLRVGVNTGEVLVGALRAGGEYTAMGDVVNIANRLEDLAGPGQVVVGPETWAATRDIIHYEPLGAVEVRGRDEAVEAWLALEAVAPPGSRRREHRSPLVGRDAEMAMLERSLHLSVTHNRPQFVLLVGEAGMGKTRLAREVAGHAASEHGALVLEGHSVPYGEASAWWPVAEIVRQICGVTENDGAEAARPKCRRAVAEVVVEEADPASSDGDDGTGGPDDPDGEVARTAEGLLWIMGIPGALADVEAGRAREEAGRAIRVVFDGLARRQPLVIVVSDVQWADPLVLELFDRFLAGGKRLPMILLCTARPDLRDRWRPAPGLHNLLVLNLDPLPAEEAGRLLDVLLGDDVDQDVRATLLERSGGNPFYLEELVALLEDTGVLAGERRSGEVVLRALPATLRGLVAARLDGLGAVERAVVEDAAVLGRRGPVAALEWLGDARGDSCARASADLLVSRDVLVIEGDQVGFKSDVVREVAYGTLTKGERARRHARVASWLESSASTLDGEDERLEEVARHYATAAELLAELGEVGGVPADVRDKALDALERAAERSETRETHLSTERLYTFALRVLGDEDDRRRRPFLVGRARARAALREHAPARADLDSAFAEALVAGDRETEASGLTVLGDIERYEGDVVRSAETLGRAVAIWRALGDRRGEAAALRRLGITRMFSGDFDGAERAASEALDAFREVGVRRGEAWALQNLAWIAFTRGDRDTAEERLHASSAMFQEIGDFGGRGWALGLLAWVRYFQGRTAEAESLAVRMLEDARELGDRWAVGMMTVLIASIRMWQGRTEETIELASGARTSFLELADAYGRTMATGVLARALAAMGRLRDAEDLLREERELAGSTTMLASREMGITVRASIAMQLGDGERALDELGRPGGMPSATHSPAFPERNVTASLALLQIGRPEEAVAELEETLTETDSEGERSYAYAALALARAAAGDAEGAEGAASALDALGKGTYSDRFLAASARALVAARTGDVDAALRRADEVDAIAQGTADRVAHGLAGLVRGWVAHSVGDPEAGSILADAREHLAALGVQLRGWETAFAAAAGAAATA